jgi:hypothetical protein
MRPKLAAVGTSRFAVIAVLCDNQHDFVVLEPSTEPRGEQLSLRPLDVVVNICQLDQFHEVFLRVAARGSVPD